MRKQCSIGAKRVENCKNSHRNKAICGVFWVEWGSDTTFGLKHGIFEGSYQETAYLPL